MATIDEYPDRHPCRYEGWPACPHTVQFDDEPYCYTHSPDSGSSVRGYSDRRAYGRTPEPATETIAPWALVSETVILVVAVEAIPLDEM